MIDLECAQAHTQEALNFEQVALVKLPLVDKFYQSQDYNIKCGRNERVFTLSHPEKGIIAAARLVPQGTDYWLRNLLVARPWRQKGLGKLLMQTLLPELQPGACYCFALTHVEAFYSRLGFHGVLPEACNSLIAQRYQQYRARGRDWVLMKYAKNADHISQSSS